MSNKSSGRISSRHSTTSGGDKSLSLNIPLKRSPIRSLLSSQKSSYSSSLSSGTSSSISAASPPNFKSSSSPPLKSGKTNLNLSTTPSDNDNSLSIHEPESESFNVDDSQLNSGFNTLNSGSRSSDTIDVATAFQAINTNGPLHILDLPIRVTKHIFTFVPLEDLLTCMLVCSAWYNVLGDENIKVWKSNCTQRLKREIIHSDHLKLCPTYKSKLRALVHAWNPHDCSPNASIVDYFTFQRSQVPQTSDGCRARIGFREGRHVWQIVWQDPLGSAAVVGVATRSTIMSKPGYIPLLGHDRHSWGWNLQNNVLIHKGDSHSYYPSDPKIRYKVGEIIHVLLDCEEKTLSFKKNGQFLGIAFRDLPVPKKELFPAISSVYGGTRVTMVYLGTLPPNSSHNS